MMYEREDVEERWRSLGRAGMVQVESDVAGVRERRKDVARFSEQGEEEAPTRDQNTQQKAEGIEQREDEEGASGSK